MGVISCIVGSYRALFMSEQIIKSKIEDDAHMHIPKSTLGFIFFAAKQNAFLGLVAIIAVTLAQLCWVLIPYILKQIIDLAGAEGTGSEHILFWVLLFPVTMLTMFMLFRVSGFVGMQWLTRTEIFAYKVLFEYLMQHSHTYFSNRFSGSVSNKLAHASEGTHRLLDSTLWGHYGAFLSLVTSGVLIFYTSTLVGIVYVTLIAILIPANLFLTRYRRPYVVTYASERTALRGSAVDVVTNMGTVRQFAQSESEYNRISHSVERMRIADIKQWKLSEWGLLFNNVIIVSAVALMLVIMYQSWVAGTVSAGDFIVVLTLMMNLSGTLVFIGSAMNQFIRVYGEVEEGLTEILLPHDIVDEKSATALKAKSGEIVWKNVTFSYEENIIFENFNLVVKSGERIGLVGSSGAGKTTFVSLLLRQHELNDGEILIDAQNIAHVTQNSLRENISLVPQEPMLFHRSVRENILYGKTDATDAEIMVVAKKAQAHDFISTLSKGYDTLVGERGVKLSGGQKQRVAIARAMLKNAPILVLDEATSALDSESEVAIQKALHELMAGKTVIAIAHRLSTLREMDRIIVLENGKIVEDGTHDALTKAGGLYARLWEHQAGGFLQD